MLYKRKDLTLSEKLFFPEIIKGLFVTIKYFFEKKVTLEYPDEKWVVPKGYRGFPRLVMGEDGIERCVACKLCERICPSEAIWIEIGEYRDQTYRERVPKQFVIDMGRCILCGYCVEACPVDAIVLSEEYEFSRYTKEELVFSKEVLLSDYREKIRKYSEKK